MMLTVVWDPHGFHLIDVLPKGSKFNAGHYISHILSLLREILLLIKMTESDMLRFTLAMPDLSVSARLLYFWITIPHAERLVFLVRQFRPSNFWLFGYLKGGLQGSSFDERDEVLSTIQEILRGVDPETLHAIFQE
jgi:hypothetical protein